MSSNAFSTAICPDPLLRRVVAGSGIALGIIGVVLIATLPASVSLRVLASTAWCVMLAWEAWVLGKAWQNCRAVRLSAGGEVAILDANARWQPGRLVPGGVLLSRIGWIRLQVVGGPVFAELVRGRRRVSPDWRRLHVIWRHVGAPE